MSHLLGADNSMALWTGRGPAPSEEGESAAEDATADQPEAER